jgi:hypothetical protein
MRLFALDGTKVFVFLADVFGVEKWRTRVARGDIPGMNDVLPYGYHHAAGEGWSIEFSKGANESAIGRLVRRSLTRSVGFDLMHACFSIAGTTSPRRGARFTAGFSRGPMW